MLLGGTRLLAAHFSGTLLFCVSIISLARTAGFLLLPLLPPAAAAADCTRPPALLPLPGAEALPAELASAAVDESGLKPLTVTLRGKPMVRMRVCSFSRAVVAASSTLVCLQCSMWDVLLALVVQQQQVASSQQHRQLSKHHFSKLWMPPQLLGC